MTRFAGALAAFTAVVGFLLGLIVMGSPPRTSNGAPGLRKADTPPVTVAAAAGPEIPASGVPVDFSAVASHVNAAVVAYL